MKKLVLAISLAAAFISGTLMIPQYVSADHQADFAAIINGLNTYGQYQSTIINGLVQVIIDTNAALQAQIDALPVSNQQCSVGKVIVGFDVSANPICKTLSVVEDPKFTLDSGGDVGQTTSIAIGTDGFPVISYYDFTNGALKVAKCANASCSSATLSAIDIGVNEGLYTSIAIGTDGRPVISYYDVTNGNLKVAKCASVTCFLVSGLSAVDTTGDVGLYTSIAIGTDGFPVISYYDQTNGNLKVLKCGNASCSVGNVLSPVDTAGDVGSFTSIAIGTDGFPVISYYDFTNGNLKFAKCANASCSSATLSALDRSDNNVGAFSSIAIGTDGFPVISYYDATFGDLKLFGCNNVSCSLMVPIILPVQVDSTGDVGAFSSIAIGTDGFPVISYYDFTNGNLKVVKCSPACSSATLDTAGDVGRSTSIAIGTDGLPVISYYDFTNGNLKVAQIGISILLT